MTSFRSEILDESFGQPEKHDECAVEPDYIGVRDTAKAIVNVAPRHRGDLVDHDRTWLFGPRRGRGFHRDPGQRCLDRTLP